MYRTTPYRTTPFRTVLAIVTLGLTSSPLLFAGSHLWSIHEVFSNDDGSIQFIELKECCGAANEIFMEDKWVLSDATGTQFVFPEDLPPDSTAYQHLLLATEAFAALPGAPTPDYIIPENFFDLNEDTLRYYLYGNILLSFVPGELPVDGLRSLAQEGITQLNSPTNFAGETGTVNASGGVTTFVRGDVDGDGVFNGLIDALALLNYGFVPGSPAPPCEDAADANDDGLINALIDATQIFNFTFVPGSPPVNPPHPGCGSDSTDDALTCGPSLGCL